jgi:hypothetical protein
MIMTIFKGKWHELIGQETPLKSITYGEGIDPHTLGEDIEREVNERDGMTITIVLELLPDDPINARQGRR